ncbi:MAG: hypothetical protein ACLRQF_12160 [Thomasclavelia ramosa]
MKLFILENCPHCRNARRWIKELQDENPEYNQIEIELIDEQINSELAISMIIIMFQLCLMGILSYMKVLPAKMV